MTEPVADRAYPRRMLGRYEIIAEIARGGMGAVLLARLEGAGGFERLMAIKLMHEHLAQDEQFIAMLLDEARTAAAIHHPNAVGILDTGHAEIGYYLVMTYVEGFNLAQVVGHRALGARERIRIGLRLLIDAAHGLHSAHTAKDAQGRALSITHRDVSPQNVLVGLDGAGRIVDFGIALATSRIASSRPGVLKGKPSYMAPEQARGEPCDPRTDIFALGVMAWEILVGERLFFADADLAILLKVLEAKIDPPSASVEGATPELDAVVMGALERDPEKRTHDARTFAVALEKAADKAGLLAPTHEVADAIERLFKDEIAARQEAIRHHLSTPTGPKKPLLMGQLGLIPKLYDRSPPGRSSEVAQNDSGVRSVDARASEVPSHRTMRLDSSVPEEPSPPPAPEKRSYGPWIALLLAIAGLAMLGVAFWLWNRAPDPAPRAPVPAPVEEEIAPEPPPPPPPPPEAPRVEPARAEEPPPPPPEEPRPRRRRVPDEPEEDPDLERNPYTTR